MGLPTRLIFGEELIKIAHENEDFVVCSADTKTCGLEKFGKYFPGREFSFGIAEQNLAAASVGLASCGNKVFFATYAVFATMRACEQVRTYICQPKFNVTILATHAGLLTGTEGASHIAIEDISIMRSFPNITIIEPSDGVSARAMVQAAVDFEGPLYVRLHFKEVPDIHDPNTYRFEIGKARPYKETGDDVTFMVSGVLLSKVIEAEKILREEGINARIIEFPTIKPIDEQAIIKAAKETGAIVTVEDHTILGGLGSAISEVVVENYPVPMKRIGIRDMFGESGEPELLYQKHRMTVSDIVEAAKEVISRK